MGWSGLETVLPRVPNKEQLPARPIPVEITCAECDGELGGTSQAALAERQAPARNFWQPSLAVSPAKVYLGYLYISVFGEDMLFFELTATEAKLR
ncbi:hypothetical protein GE061_002288 [Apolygus lucorum]|uniref:Uncharacterized protein n=1 Tax=Apolygus lucorum TaxID=248454 RepID=A0A6A4JFL9_APOLU|nr:hypothetical protein GE061_002288 [Apolygus lucorum]